MWPTAAKPSEVCWHVMYKGNVMSTQGCWRVQRSELLSFSDQVCDFTWLGPVCIMYSRMGKGLHEKDLEFNTHEAFYKQYPVIADVLFIENVTEYPRSVVESHLGPGLWGSGCAGGPKECWVGSRPCSEFLRRIQEGENHVECRIFPHKFPGMHFFEVSAISEKLFLAVTSERPA